MGCWFRPKWNILWSQCCYISIWFFLLRAWIFFNCLVASHLTEPGSSLTEPVLWLRPVISVATPVHVCYRADYHSHNITPCALLFHSWAIGSVSVSNVVYTAYCYSNSVAVCIRGLTCWQESLLTGNHREVGSPSNRYRIQRAGTRSGWYPRSH